MPKSSPSKAAADAARKGKGKGWVFLVPIALGAAAVAVYFWTRPSPRETAKSTVAIADGAKRGVSAFFECLIEDEPGVDLWVKKEDSLRILMAKHYHGLPDRLRSRCLPDLEKAGGGLKASGELPHAFTSALEGYRNTLRRVDDLGNRFAQKGASRAEEEAAFHEIATSATEWAQAPLAPEAAPFERFFVCAVPGLPAMKDSKELFQHFSTACFHGDPVEFMRRAHRECGPALHGGPVTVSAADAMSARRFHGNPGFMRMLWEACAKDAYKVWMSSDDGDEVVQSLDELRTSGTRLIAAALQQPPAS